RDGHVTGVQTCALPIFGHTLALGDAANGLCGGMVYVVCDYFEAKQDIPSATDAPPGGSDLYKFIVHRLLQSFNLPFGLNRYLERSEERRVGKEYRSRWA